MSNSTMHIHIDPYGPARQWLGEQRIELDLEDGGCVADVARLLAQRYPEFAPQAQRCAFALGDGIVPASQTLQDGARLALIPPVSGG